MVTEKKSKYLNRLRNLIVNSPVMVLLIWELFVRLNFIHKGYFPPPSAIITRLFYLVFQSSEFLYTLWCSVKRLALGTLIAFPSGILLGFAIGLNQKFEKILSPLLAITYPIPKLAILPFLMIIFGIGDTSKIAIIAIGVFYYVVFNVIHGVRELAATYFDIAFIYRVPLIKKLFYVIFKGVLPDILNGCKIGLGYGLIMVIASEFIAAKNGIGFFMWNAWDQFRIIDMYASLVVLSVIGSAIFLGFDYLRDRLPWKKINHDNEAI
ncbi:MAG: ABC transporter permease [Candidatus Omnitrophica bacterium]|nr:ABC transporter permease [Candidatus Omnitrophota bacterium]